MTRSKFMPEFLTGQQAAKEVGRSGATITGWATQGILPIADNDGARGRSRYRAADVVFAARSKGADVRVAEGRLSPACRAEYDEKIGDGELSADGAAGESYDEARARKQRADASLAESGCAKRSASSWRQLPSSTSAPRSGRRSVSG